MLQRGAMLEFLKGKRASKRLEVQPWRISQLGRIYIDSGRTLEEGVQNQKRTVASSEKEHGPNHPETLKAKQNLAVLYSDQGKVDKAEAIYKKVIATREKVDGINHRETIKAINDLGTVYSSMERWVDAQGQYERALKAQEALSGEGDAATIGIVGRLGVIYAQQNKLDQARVFLERAVQGSERIYGSSNPKTLQLLTDLASICCDLQRYNEAEAMYSRALEGLEQSLGPDDRETLWTVSHLAKVYVFQERKLEARQFYERAWKGFQKVLGPTHPETLRVASFIKDPLLIKEKPVENEDLEEISSRDLQVPTPSVSKDQSESSEVFNQSILIADAQWQYKSATALLDTQCQHGNWISKRLVDRLGRQSDIRKEDETPNAQDVNGQEVLSLGTIKLSWKWNLRSRVFDANFHVFKSSEHFDILFGVEYIVAEGMVSFNAGTTDVIAPLVPHKKIKASERAAIALAKEQQRQDKAALQARNAAEAQTSQQQGQSSTSGQTDQQGQEDQEQRQQQQ